MCHNVNSLYAGYLKRNPREKIIQSPRDLDPQVKNHWIEGFRDIMGSYQLALILLMVC